MPLPEGFIPIYGRPLTVDPVYRRYGLDNMSTGVAADAALEYARKFSPMAASDRMAALDRARGITMRPGEIRAYELTRAADVERELGEARARALTYGPEPTPMTGPGPYPDATMRPPPTLSPLLQPDELNKRYGVEGRLKFDKPDYEEAARLLNEWAIEDVTREDTLRRADSDIGAVIARAGAGLLGSMLDPLNVASAFVPVVPEMMYLNMVSRLGVTGARAARGAAEGFVGTALLEPVVYFQSQAEQADYGLWDVLANLTFGTVLGGGLHVGVGAVGDAVSRMRWRDRAEVLRASVGQFVDRGEVRVDGALSARPPQVVPAEMLSTRPGQALGEAAIYVEGRLFAAESHAVAITKAEAAGISEAVIEASIRRGNIGRLDEDGKFQPIERDGDLRVAVRKKDDGAIVAGEAGEVHSDIYTKLGEPASGRQYDQLASAYDEGFVGKDGVFLTRAEARDALVAPRDQDAAMRDIGLDGDDYYRTDPLRWEQYLARQGAEGVAGITEKGPPNFAAADPLTVRASDPAAAVRSSLAPSSETVVDLHTAGEMADIVAKAPKADTPEASIAAIQKDMATLDEQIRDIGPEIPERATAEGEAQPKLAAWLDAEDRAYLAEADDMIAEAAAKADVARVAALCGLGVG